MRCASPRLNQSALFFSAQPSRTLRAAQTRFASTTPTSFPASLVLLDSSRHWPVSHPDPAEFCPVPCLPETVATLLFRWAPCRFLFFVSPPAGSAHKCRAPLPFVS